MVLQAIPLVRLRPSHLMEGVQTGRVRKMSVVVPQDLNTNVKPLHQMFFDEQDYEPSSTVKTCSSKIASDTGIPFGAIK